MKKVKREAISFTLLEGDARKIKEIAEEQDRSVSQVVRNIVNKELNKEVV